MRSGEASLDSASGEMGFKRNKRLMGLDARMVMRPAITSDCCPVPSRLFRNASVFLWFGLEFGAFPVTGLIRPRLGLTTGPAGHSRAEPGVSKLLHRFVSCLSRSFHSDQSANDPHLSPIIIIIIIEPDQRSPEHWIRNRFNVPGENLNCPCPCVSVKDALTIIPSRPRSSIP